MGKQKCRLPIPERKRRRGKRAVKQDISRLNEKLEAMNKAMAAVQMAHSMHIEALSNFLGHDMKNCIQNMDVILSNYSAEEITNDNLDSLRSQLGMIREIMRNFTQLVPHGELGVFKVNNLIGGTESLTRSTLAENNITFEKELLTDIDLSVNYPFHALLQVFVNLILNACTHLKDVDNPKVLFKIGIDETACQVFFSIYDNGLPISDMELDRIFEYGYSTTGGSGIGLPHARYICEVLKGTIECAPSDRDEYSKRFLITLPFKGLDDV